MIDIKMVIVIRKDLHMRKGKIVAQACHGAVEAVLSTLGDLATFEQTQITNQWLDTGAKKICLYCESLEELEDIVKKCSKDNLYTEVVYDFGLTEFHGQETITCLVIGPDLSEKVDPIIGHLKLL